MRTARVPLVIVFSIILLVSIHPIPTARGSNAAPVASFIYSPAYPQPNDPLTFNASASYDPDGYIVMYQWNFGDGYTANITYNPYVQHTYLADGTYQVVLQVVDNGGSRSVTAQTLTVNCNEWFRVVDSSGNPISNVTVTVYKGNSASSTNWQTAPANNNGVEIKYDYLTQPDLANNDQERFRNPGITASVLRDYANIGFETHPSTWYVFFKFQWGSNVFYWPNEPSRVFSYTHGIIETHYYSSSHEAVFNSAAGTYVIKTGNIPSDGVAPASGHPILISGPSIPTLAVSISPSSATLDIGQSKTFTSTVLGGSSPYSYQWYLNGGAVSGATSPTWTFTPTSSGSYTVYLNVTDSTSTRVKSNIASITVNPTLSISISPALAKLDVGQSQAFGSSVSGGTSPLSYQWYLNGAPVSGATSASWTFTPASAGSYTVYANVTDNVGCRAKSNTATVTVSATLSVSISPTSFTMDVGQSKTFTSTVSGGIVPYAYQWYLNGVPVSGATGSAWIFTPMSSGSYNVYLRVTDAVGGGMNSNTVPVTVNGALSVSVSPASATLDVGQSKLFTATASGGTTPNSYQWYLNGASVPGATGPTWTFTPTSSGSYTIFVNVTDNVGLRVKSNVASVTVNSAPSVSISPSSAVMDVGQSQLFTSSVTGGTSPFSYQWYLNGAPVSGATNPTWAFAPASTGSYTVLLKVTDSLGILVTSNSVLVVVNGALSVSISPASATLDVGQSQLFSSSVSGGTSPYSYQWYLNGAPVSGATSPSWTFTPASSGHYNVFVRVSDNVGTSSDSNTASVTVNPTLTVSISPGSASIYLGQSQAFTSSVSGGTSPCAYQWYLNGSPVSGATSSSWTFTPTSTGAYLIYLKVTDSVSAIVQSSQAQLIVNSPPSLTVSISPSSAVIDLTQSVAFSSSVSGGTSPFSYQWYLNSVPVSGATSSSWTFSPASTGYYQVYLVVTDSLSAQGTSSTAPVTVNSLPSVTISPTTVTIDLSQSKLFTSSVSGGTSPCAYQWYLNGSPVSGATGSTWTFAPSVAGTYHVYLVATDNVGMSAQSGTSNVTVNPALSVGISPSSVVMDVGQSQLFTSSVSGGTSPFSYQWYINSAPVSGVTSASWTFTPTSPGTYMIYVRVTDSADVDPSAQSPSSQVVVNPAPTISIVPSSATIDMGQSKNFTSSVSGGTAPFSYQWYLNGVLVSGATGASWGFTPASTGSFSVYVNLTDSVGIRVKSNVASVTVNAALSVSITPTSVVMDVGQSRTFTSSVSGGTSPFSYQWYLGGAPVSGATGSTWTFTPTSSGTYTIYIVVTDGADIDPSAQSSPASVIVNSAPTVSVSPASVTMDATQSQLFTSSPSGGTGPYSYQWYLDGSPVLGATGSSCTFTVSSAGSHTVYLIITDSVGVAATSNTVHITVNGMPTVTISPASASVHVGDTVSFSSSPSGGTTPYSYQWYLDGAAVSGATNPTWMFSESAGSYTVYLNITDSVGMKAKSNVATVTVLIALSASITPSGASVTLGQSVPFTSTVNGGVAPYYYQWYLGSLPVTGGTSSSWTFTPSATGTYDVHLNVTDSMGHSIRSSVAQIIVSHGPVGGRSESIIAFPMLATWLTIISFLAAAVMLSGIIVRKKRT